MFQYVLSAISHISTSILMIIRAILVKIPVKYDKNVIENLLSHNDS